MKADKSKMFSVPLKDLKAGDAAPFPLYLFLRKNNRFVPLRLPGDPIGMQKYEAFLNRKFDELWVPNNFQEIYQTYLDYAAKTGHPAQDISKAVEIEEKENSTPKIADAPKEEAKSEEAAIVRDVFEDEELNSEDKARILSAVSQDLLRSLNKITTRGEAARASGLKSCKEIADEVLMVASQNSNIYDEILALRNSQEELEHSVVVGTISVMFGLAIGMVDEILLADLTLAAIFHDIGLVRIRPEILSKSEITWSAQERAEYETHVNISVEILKESGTEFHPRIFRMVKEHHENYDGSGFPEHLKGTEIDELSQIMHLSNLFDRLCTGKQTGEELSPADAFKYIANVANTAGAIQEVRPELIQRVFQFMITEKQAADSLREEGKDRAQAVMMSIIKS